MTVLPLVLPRLSAAALICFMFTWHEYFLALDNTRALYRAESSI